MRKALHVIRNIRNGFAHSKRPLHFEHDVVREQFRDLLLPQNKRSKVYKRLHCMKTDILPKEAKGTAIPPRLKFIFLCTMASTALLRKDTARLKAQSARLRKKIAKDHAQIVSPSQSRPITLGPGLLNYLFENPSPQSSESYASRLLRAAKGNIGNEGK
jgi:hypothetical protein